MMDIARSLMMGFAFALGVRYAKSKTLAFDEAEWITVRPNGPQHTGRPVLIDNVTGQVLGGMGGKFNGRHISAVKNKGKNEQPGAQMQITARDPVQKAAAMNNQRIDFKTNRSAIEAENANLNKQIKDLNKKIKATSKYSPDFEALKQQKQALEEQRKVNANLLGAEKQRQQANEHSQKIKQQQAEKEARTKANSEKRLQETIEKQAQAKEEFKNKRLTEITNIKKPNDQQFLYTPIADFKETEFDYQVINPTYAMAVEKLGAKEARGYNKYISIPKESATVIDGKIQAVTEEYRNKLKRASIEAGSAKGLKRQEQAQANETFTKQASKESVSASSVLGIPSANGWNRKIYTYKNGERAVFINNKKIILNDEQYNKLKSLT